MIISKAKNNFSKYKNIIVELIINVFAFTLLVISQQTIALPFISRYTDPLLFGKIIIIFGINNIITSMLGFSIGNARLLDNNIYNHTFLKKFKISNFFVIVFSFLIFLFLFHEIVNALFFSLISLVGNFRYFIISEFRIKNAHNSIFKQNLFYFLGILLGVASFYFVKNWLIIFFIAELLAIIVSFKLTSLNFFKRFKDKTYIKSTNINQLILSNGASYSLSQYDRFVIYPILGAFNVSLYYSTSVSSKIGSLIMNPVSNFILGKLSGKNIKDNNKLFKFTIKSTIIITIIYFIFSTIITPLIVKILYPSFFSNIGQLIVPICLDGGIMAGMNILKPFYIKIIGIKPYNRLFFIYSTMLIIISIVFCFKYGLIGVAYSKLIASFIFLILQFMSLKKFILNK